MNGGDMALKMKPGYNLSLQKKFNHMKIRENSWESNSKSRYKSTRIHENPTLKIHKRMCDSDAVRVDLTLHE